MHQVPGIRNTLDTGIVLIRKWLSIHDDLSPNNYVSFLTLPGMWSSTFYFGNFVGPTASGFLVESFGFRSTTLIFFCLFAFIIFLDSCQLIYILKYIRAPKSQGYSDLDDKNVLPTESDVAPAVAPESSLAPEATAATET